MSDNYQEQYWKEMYQLKVHYEYIELYRGRSEFWDNSVKIFLAVVSSGSIGSWVIWKEYSHVWGAIIAISQVLERFNNNGIHKRLNL